MVPNAPREGSSVAGEVDEDAFQRVESRRFRIQTTFVRRAESGSISAILEPPPFRFTDDPPGDGDRLDVLGPRPVRVEIVNFHLGERRLTGSADADDEDELALIPLCRNLLTLLVVAARDFLAATGEVDSPSPGAGKHFLTNRLRSLHDRSEMHELLRAPEGKSGIAKNK